MQLCLEYFFKLYIKSHSSSPIWSNKSGGRRNRDRCGFAIHHLVEDFMKERSPDAHIAGKIELCQIKGIYKCQEIKQQDNVRPDSKAHNDKMLSGPEIRGRRSVSTQQMSLGWWFIIYLLLFNPPQLCIVVWSTDEVCGVLSFVLSATCWVRCVITDLWFSPRSSAFLHSGHTPNFSKWFLLGGHSTGKCWNAWSFTPLNWCFPGVKN